MSGPKIAPASFNPVSCRASTQSGWTHSPLDLSSGGPVERQPKTLAHALEAGAAEPAPNPPWLSSSILRITLESYHRFAAHIPAGIGSGGGEVLWCDRSVVSAPAESILGSGRVGLLQLTLRKCDEGTRDGGSRGGPMRLDAER